MSVIHVKKHTANFIVMDKTGLNDKRLSWKATGLHSYLMGLPDNWKINVADLRKRKMGGRDQIYTMLKELEKRGYIKRVKLQDEKGRMNGYDYTAHEHPVTAS
jgi:DNA-binding MarR family transcriptional regulator